MVYPHDFGIIASPMAAPGLAGSGPSKAPGAGFWKWGIAPIYGQFHGMMIHHGIFGGQSHYHSFICYMFIVFFWCYLMGMVQDMGVAMDPEKLYQFFFFSIKPR